MRNLDQWYEATLTGFQQVTPTVREFTIDCPNISASPPGAHINVRVYIDGRPDHRSYSVVGHPAGGGVVIAVKYLPDSRGGSAYMWTLQAGARIWVTPPANDFGLSFNSGEYLLLAGGIGITPIVRMAETLMEQGRPMRLLYAARTRDELAYFTRLEEQLKHRLEIFVAEEQRFVDLSATIGELSAACELYMCGPLGLMEAVRSTWLEAGRDPTKLHYETFGSSGRHPAKAFSVLIANLGIEVQVPKDKSLLDALTDAGVEVLSDCRRGECGLCALKVVSIEGEADHRDVFFSPKQHREGEFMCACVSRIAEGRVVLETALEGDPVLRKSA
ncbi:MULTISPECIES: PDR/VanB family oxidoreductase [unclassified Pseudomonas]|uniref:PDR/VanB family oxidoreductase n=1 Tax=unclassified Pseudomonas TaxID=196821 RepID=UPI002E823DCF|nr:MULTISPECIES: PDR/VanB family oxidoreductase [unclassified Pseudomonas]